MCRYQGQDAAQRSLRRAGTRGTSTAHLPSGHPTAKDSRNSSAPPAPAVGPQRHSSSDGDAPSHLGQSTSDLDMDAPTSRDRPDSSASRPTRRPDGVPQDLRRPLRDEPGRPLAGRTVVSDPLRQAHSTAAGAVIGVEQILAWTVPRRWPPGWQFPSLRSTRPAHSTACGPSASTSPPSPSHLRGITVRTTVHANGYGSGADARGRRPERVPRKRRSAVRPGSGPRGSRRDCPRSRCRSGWAASRPRAGSSRSW